MSEGVDLDALISRIPYAVPVSANLIKTWPNLATAATVTSGAPGSWVQLISAAGAPTTPFIVFAIMNKGIGGNVARSDLEVGIGGGGSEVPVGVAYNPNGGAGFLSVFPRYIIPGGTRVAVRSITLNGEATAPLVKIVTMSLQPMSDSHMALLRSVRLTNFYPGRTDHQFATINPTANAAAWTYGAIAEVVTATAATISAAMSFAFAFTSAVTDGQVAMMTGAGSSEVVFAEFPQCDGNAATTGGVSVDLPCPIIIPASTRLSAKVASSAGGGTPIFQPSFTLLTATGGILP